MFLRRHVGAKVFPASRRLISTNSSFSKPFKFALKAMGYYGDESTNIRTGQALLRSCEAQSLLVGMDDSFGINVKWEDNNSFFVRQHVLLLHVWMIHRRLLKDGDKGKNVQEILFDSLWENTTKRVRATGVQELTVNKHLSNVQKTCFGAAVSYDHGYNCDDDNLELGSALFRNVYHSDPKTPDECVYSLATYVREQVNLLNELDASILYEAEINWIDLDVETENIFGEWRPAIASSGKTYWWNVKTRESRWTKPQ